MKKVLLTTSALTLLAGAAAADVSVAGYSRIGISNTGSATTNYLRNQVTFSGSATSDGGLTFSAWTRTRNSASGSKFAATSAFAGPQLSVSNGAVTLTVGNATGAVGSTAGAAVWGCASIMWGCADLAGASSWATQSSTGAGTNIVRLNMALGSASVAVSGGNGNDTEVAMSVPMGGGSVGIGYDQETNPNLHVGFSGSAGGMGVGVRASQSDGKTGYMANVTAPVGAGSVYVFAGKTVAGSNNYGLRYNQSLGGSVAMQAGASSVDGTTTVGAGLNFSF
jgi:outer membrane protein OmpU